MSEIRLRPVRPDDARVLFEWRSDDLTSSMSLGPAPTWQEHVAWLSERLARGEPAFYMAEVDGRPVGSVRVDYPEVSYTVSPHLRGRGYATAMLRLVYTLHGQLEARVKPNNPASAAAARKAGHRVVIIESADSG